MASHTKAELRSAARVLGEVARPVPLPAAERLPLSEADRARGDLAAAA
jgi:hypothetical protein